MKKNELEKFIDEIIELEINSTFNFPNKTIINDRLKNIFKINTKAEKELIDTIVDEYKIKLKYDYKKDNNKIPDLSKALEHLKNTYNLDFDNDNIVLLTKDNASAIAKAIKDDENYFDFAKIIFKYYGLRKIRKNINNSLFAVIREIDRDNSTNVWRYGTNRDSFKKAIEYIQNPTNKFFKRLERGDPKLPDDLKKCGSGNSLRSLSSKICKYLCEYAFINKKDNYYINDSYVRGVLPFYLKHYNVSFEKDFDLTYEGLHNKLDELREKVKNKYKEEISRNELDSILWYCYKSYVL